jgi:acyl-CoA thioester hydrolase
MNWALPLITYRGVVYPAQCDAMGHMNTPHYVGAFDQSMWHLVAALGYRTSWIQERGEGWADVKYVMEFRQELKAGELFHVASKAVQLGKSSLHSRHDLVHTESGQIAARVDMTSIYFDLKNRVSKPILAEIREAANSLIAASR